jgi:hypothetical protein
VKVCPANSYADKKSKFCVAQCPLATASGTQTYAADYNNVCVEECALPTFADGAWVEMLQHMSWSLL